MSFDRDQMARLIAAHGPVARVVVAQIAGSTPREVGAAMVVWPGGQHGTIGGGALEFEAAEAARQRLLTRVPTALDRIPLGPARGQCCGGAVTLVTEVFDDASLSQIDGPVFARALGGTGPAPLHVQRRLAQLRNGSDPVRAEFLDGWMIEPLQPAAQPLWVWGAGHVGRAIVDVLHPLPDFEITWVDTDAARFPEHMPDGISQLIATDPAELVRYAPVDARHLVLTYSHALDLDLCHRLLNHGFGFAGLIGSKTKWARFRSRLRDLGHADAQISRICCPIGRPELGKHPQAIAVGVVAELLLDQDQQDETGNAPVDRAIET